MPAAVGPVYTVFHEMLTTMPPGNTTIVPEPPKPYPLYVGYIAAIVAVILYGSNFVPIKKFYTGDGMFFQWVLCSGIFLVGVVVQLIRQSTFHPFAMIGGVLWATGNLCVVPIFKTIGMGLGMSTWSTFNLIMGWATGRFGVFGTNPDTISNPTMNYVGVALAFCSILFYLLVKNEVSGSSEVEVHNNENTSSINNDRGSSADGDSIAIFKRLPVMSCAEISVTASMTVSSSIVSRSTSSNADSTGAAVTGQADDRMFIENLPPILKKIIGTALGVFSGIMYGVQFTPATYVQQKYANASTNGLDYVFVHFCGIYATSSVYFFIYCAFKVNKPKVYPEVILPGIVSGIMWAIAGTCWFIANAELSEAVSFPIVGTCPAGIASMFWGVLIFHEIKGMRNILILIVAFCMMTGGAILAGLSK